MQSAFDCAVRLLAGTQHGQSSRLVGSSGAKRHVAELEGKVGWDASSGTPHQQQQILQGKVCNKQGITSLLAARCSTDPPQQQP